MEGVSVYPEEEEGVGEQAVWLLVRSDVLVLRVGHRARGRDEEGGRRVELVRLGFELQEEAHKQSA